jgi:hypothetical protein
MASVSPPPLVATVRGELMLLRGQEAERSSRLIDAAGRQWSPSGRGWVVSAALLADLLALAQADHFFVVISEERRAAS